MVDDWPERRYRLEETRAKSYSRSLSQDRVRTGLSLFGLLKPLIVFVLLFIFLYGPGVVALWTIWSSMPWYLWVGGLFIVLLFVRRG